MKYNNIARAQSNLSLIVELLEQNPDLNNQQQVDIGQKLTSTIYAMLINYNYEEIPGIIENIKSIQIAINELKHNQNYQNQAYFMQSAVNFCQEQIDILKKEYLAIAQIHSYTDFQANIETIIRAFKESPNLDTAKGLDITIKLDATINRYAKLENCAKKIEICALLKNLELAISELRDLNKPDQTKSDHIKPNKAWQTCTEICQKACSNITKDYTYQEANLDFVVELLATNPRLNDTRGFNIAKILKNMINEMRNNSTRKEIPKIIQKLEDFTSKINTLKASPTYNHQTFQEFAEIYTNGCANQIRFLEEEYENAINDERKVNLQQNLNKLAKLLQENKYTDIQQTEEVKTILHSVLNNEIKNMDFYQKLDLQTALRDSCYRLMQLVSSGTNNENHLKQEYQDLLNCQEILEADLMQNLGSNT